MKRKAWYGFCTIAWVLVGVIEGSLAWGDFGLGKQIVVKARTVGGSASAQATDAPRAAPPAKDSITGTSTVTSTVTSTGTSTGTSTALHVDGMTCEDCEKKISRDVAALEGVSSVTADHKTGTVVVTGDVSKIDLQKVKQTITAAGYTVAPSPK